MRRDIVAHKFIEFGKHQQSLYGVKADSILDVVNSGKMCILDVHPQVGEVEGLHTPRWVRWGGGGGAAHPQVGEVGGGGGGGGLLSFLLVQHCQSSYTNCCLKTEGKYALPSLLPKHYLFQCFEKRVQ